MTSPDSTRAVTGEEPGHIDVVPLPECRRSRLLVLWDVDHTLIETRGVGRAIYDRAFLAVTGSPLDQLATVSGRTELDIMRESLRLNGLEETDETIRGLVTALIRGYQDARDELATGGRALPGAHTILAALADNPTVFQTVLTGNLREVARIKLEVFDLDRFLDLDAGAYGDDHTERSELVAVAQHRAAKRTGTSFDNDTTILIGDTANDVAAALTAGVRVIGLATGKTSPAELQDAGATWTATEALDIQALVEAFSPA